MNHNYIILIKVIQMYLKVIKTGLKLVTISMENTCVSPKKEYYFVLNLSNTIRMCRWLILYFLHHLSKF